MVTLIRCSKPSFLQDLRPLRRRRAYRSQARREHLEPELRSTLDVPGRDTWPEGHTAARVERDRDRPRHGVQWHAFARVSPFDKREELNMAKQLVIVESPTKAKTLERYLGSDYSVTASKGHVRDLPEKGMGVEVDEAIGADPRAANRVTFTEITRDAVQNAFQQPRRIDFDLVDAQQARRIM